MLIKDNKRFTLRSEQVIDGQVVTSKAIMENMAAYGVSEIPDPARPDDRFYFVNELQEAPWIQATPKALEDVTNEDGTVTKGLKSQFVMQIKQTANSLLSSSDWKVTRAAEGIKPVDQATLDFRAAVRAASNANEAAILAVTTVEELQALFQSSGTEEAQIPPVIQWPKAD